MKTIKITLMVIAPLIIAGCSSSKKVSANSSTPSYAITPTNNSYLFVKPTVGINVPGNEELVAILVKFAEATLDKLKEGHAIYTQGACINCHGANNIYNYGEAQWETIIEDMAQKAMISDSEKDAVYKYVLSIKATQPK